MPEPLPPPRPGLAARRLGPDDAAAVARLRAEVLAALPDPDLYVGEDDADAFVHAHLGSGAGAAGLTIGVHDAAGALVAYGMLGLPGAGDPEHLARWIGAGSAGLAATATLASCMVAPAWRGHALQRWLTGARLALAQAHGRRRVVALVSPHNHESRHNLLACGLRITWVGDWHGLPRQGLAMDLEEPGAGAPDTATGVTPGAATPAEPATDTLRWVAADDLAAQQRLIAAGAVAVAERRAGTGLRAVPQLGFRLPAPHPPPPLPAEPPPS